MLGHGIAGPRDDKSRHRGDIKRPAPVASRAAGVHERFSVRMDRNGRRAHGFGRSGELVDRFSFDAQGRQKRRHQDGRELAADERGKSLLRFRPGQRPAIHHFMQQRQEVHDGFLIFRLKKLANSFFPFSVRMDSG